MRAIDAHGLRLELIAGANLLPVVLVALATAAVVVIVIGLPVWGAIQDGREEREMHDRRHPPGDQS